ncbi:AzlD domain-containing protein [Rhizobiaceae bacterium]|nr:AzlD domain-containing protein [Rhizobiaceae bacterium]
MSYTAFDTWWWPFVFILLFGAIPTAMWRWIGVLAIGEVDEKSEWLVLVRCIATSLVAAVIAQIVLFPSGALAEAPFALRLGAAAAGFAAFLLAERRMIVGIVVGEAILLGWMLLS